MKKLNNTANTLFYQTPFYRQIEETFISAMKETNITDRERTDIIKEMRRHCHIPSVKALSILYFKLLDYARDCPYWSFNPSLKLLMFLFDPNPNKTITFSSEVGHIYTQKVFKFLEYVAFNHNHDIYDDINEKLVQIIESAKSELLVVN